jgi:hypothetical protein
VQDVHSNLSSVTSLYDSTGIISGVINGPGEPLVIGDDYLTVLNRSIHVDLLNSAGAPATVTFGSKSLADPDCSIKLLLHKSGKPTVIPALTGTCTFNAASGSNPPYLIVELPRTQTTLATPGAYDIQAEAKWADGTTITFAPYGQVTFVRDILRGA